MTTDEDYAQLKELAEKAGVADVTKAYNEYSKLAQASYDALNEQDVDVSYSTAGTSA